MAINSRRQGLFEKITRGSRKIGEACDNLTNLVELNLGREKVKILIQYRGMS